MEFSIRDIGPYDPWPLERVQKFVLDAKEFVELLNWTANEMPRDERGQNWLLRHLIRGFATILKREVTTSKTKYGPDNKCNVRDYIIKACQIADPDLKAASIDYAMRMTIRERNEIKLVRRNMKK